MAITLSPPKSLGNASTVISRSQIVTVESTLPLTSISWGVAGAWTSAGGFLPGYSGTVDGGELNLTISKDDGFAGSSFGTFVAQNGSDSEFLIYIFNLLVDVELLSSTLVKLTGQYAAVVDEAYYDPSNYVLSTSTGPGPAVVGVLNMNETSTNEIILVTNTLEKGLLYTIQVSNLTLRNGNSYDLSGDFETRATKLDSILRSIPNHYDTRSESNIHALLTAIATSDDLIGGSRSDSITFD